jgi:hypothetical protein
LKVNKNPYKPYIPVKLWDWLDNEVKNSSVGETKSDITEAALNREMKRRLRGK